MYVFQFPYDNDCDNKVQKGVMSMTNELSRFLLNQGRRKRGCLPLPPPDFGRLNANPVPLKYLVLMPPLPPSYLPTVRRPCTPTSSYKWC